MLFEDKHSHKDVMASKLETIRGGIKQAAVRTIVFHGWIWLIATIGFARLHQFTLPSHFDSLNSLNLAWFIIPAITFTLCQMKSQSRTGCTSGGLR
jgi:hypothetical protein